MLPIMLLQFLFATGQDTVQNVESSNGIKLLEENENRDLWISCTMPIIKVGTASGGTSLPALKAGLMEIGCQDGIMTPDLY